MLENAYGKKESKRQANFLLPEHLLSELRELVPSKMRSQVVATALDRELSRIKAKRALSDYFGAWRPSSGTA